ncbi:L-threonine dehydratase catabolic TdcB [Thermus aquaticus]|uniref:L-threonine dehydratase catabolic TdcB n=1 Tax=Thermus aquaticus TaxID=271 RepID=A0A0N0U813_THEAQ|nr:L-threonine dehydratase catabolic TdcB [Thermus aquaticus]
MDLASLRAAYRRIAPHTHRTPLLTSRLLDELLGKRLLLKAEHLQKTGSFKARGALAKALTLESPKGLLAVSSGNHAQGVAYAARVLGVRALLVIPEEASPLKKAAARAYGAEVVERGVPPSPPPRRARGRPPRPSAWWTPSGAWARGRPWP